MQPHFKTDCTHFLSSPHTSTRFVALRSRTSSRLSFAGGLGKSVGLALSLGFLSTSATRPTLAQPPIVSQNPTNAPAAQPAGEPGKPGGLTLPVGGDEKADATPTPAPATTENPVLDDTPPVVVPGGTAGDAGDGGSDINDNLQGRTIAKVSVSGSRVVPEETILQQATGTRVGGVLTANQLQADLRRIDALGFFVAVAQQVTPNLEDTEKVDVVFVVTENRPVTGFTFVGNARIPSADLQAVLTTKTDTILNRNSINTDVGKIQSLYSERGLAAQVTESRQTEDGKVVFTVQEARIGRIDIAGLRKTKESLVRKLIRTKKGDAFDQIALRRDLNAIYDTGLFDDISYKVTDEPASVGSVIVTISVKEKRSGQFSVGLSFDNRSKLGGFVTVGENNLFGQGKRASASVELGSQSTRTFELAYGDSYVGSKLASYDVSIFNRLVYREPRLVSIVTGIPTDKQFQYREQRSGLRFNFTNPLNLQRDTSLLFGFRAERAQLQQTNANDGSNSRLLDSSGSVVAFSGGFLRDKRDLQTEPSRGGRQQFILEQAIKGLGATTQFTKIDVDLRQYFPLIGPPKNFTKGTLPLPRLVLAGRLVVGKSLGQLPAFEQYFVGGSDTVRGYNADEQFGDNQFYSNLELRFRLNQQFQLVGFTDVGKASGGRFSSDLVNSKVLFSVGVGVRVKTPIGPVRLDIAKGSRGIKTHFGIGSTF